MRETLKSTYSKTLFLRIFAILFGAFGCPVAFAFGLFSLELLVTAAISMFLSIPLFFAIHYSGELLGSSFYGFGRRPDARDQVKSDVLKAKHFLASGNFIRATELADYVLSKEPDLGDALLVRAQIAMRQDDEQTARKMLRHIVAVCPRGDENRRWALNYLREMNEEFVS